ncbi:uncharacterized protein Tco025E_02014 [Trypanosoma conorhini]|uniref:Trypanosoma Tc-38 (p38) protein domain-containing protein n=1 Tax=Trypanosoma conorhini TaxID=83891 RepID=A0A3R7LEN1_9TRYP|nr:uncharacterized protein Tco025E_02014 [Trypanosoma conorhini]RNF25715.1 hypothetical protein Tco025E_02014 [Trypanosoma conorhini]
MTLQQPRLSISNCVLPTAVDWAVMRALRDWHNNARVGDASTAPSARPITEEPSPFWITAKAVRFLANALPMERQSLRTPTHVPMNGMQTTQRNGASQMGGNYFTNRNRIVNAFGISFVNAADTPICSVVDSCTCASCGFPVSESGDIIWELLGKVKGMSRLRFALPTAPEGDKHGADSMRFPSLFQSPYWLAGEGLERRWKGVTIAPNVTPVYVEHSSHWFVNAEQTSDASRFDCLSCTPHRRHQCLTKDGVCFVSLNLSAKLAEAFLEMTKGPGTTQLAPGDFCKPAQARRNSHEHSCFYAEEAQPQQTTEDPSNLWLDVGLLESAGWSLQEAAVGVELQPRQLTMATRSFVSDTNSANVGAKPIVVVNAGFVRERDSLLDVIAYKPQYIGLEQNTFFAPSTTVRLALLAHTMRYTSPTWIAAAFAERVGLRGRKGHAATGVEVELHCNSQTATTKIVLINSDELELTQERIADLRGRKA